MALLLGCASLLLAAPAEAAVKTVSLTGTGPSPSPVTIAKGDSVRFLNTDNVAHTVSRSAGSWSFKATIAPGQSAKTGTFGTAGNFDYADTYTLIAIPQSNPGRITVSAGTAPPPTASPKPTAGPTKSPAPRPTATRSPTPVAPGSASPSAQPIQTGTAVLPGIGTGQIPVPTPGQTAGPAPDIASPDATTSGSAVPVAPNLTYSGRGLVQGSPHRYGLPAALALVGIVGVLSLLVRILLAEPAARRRRTGGPVTLES